MMRYGIYGGAFDPGHLLLAETCLRQAQLDRIIFVPSGVSPHVSGKDSYRASAEDRYNMVSLAIQDCEKFQVSRLELDRAGRSYTVDTLRFFVQNLEPSAGLIFLLMGADMFCDLPNWREPAEICRLAMPLVACRPGTEMPSTGEFHAQKISMPLTDISSTRIRAAVAAGESISAQVPLCVEQYIQSRGLYAEIR